MTPELIPRRALHDELADRIRQMIIEGDLQADQKVPEKDLCARFGVSRTPLREALKVLANDGLLVLTPNRGSTVAGVTEQDIQDVFPVMSALESLSGELAVQNMSDVAIAKLQQTHAAMVKAYRAKDLPLYFRLNQEIHRGILQGSGNAALIAVYDSLNIRITRMRYVADMTKDRWAQAVAEHVVMMDALTNRDGNLLSEVLRHHLENKRETVLRWVQKSKKTKVK
ncbi:MAG: GntR family transcriptional regulator [Alphaproteobacteria bacterium]|nr:GntR family transcriptional regulator [Alphaproteobacteria bacterium]